MTDAELSISDVTLIARLRNTPNWMREGFQNWKDNVRTYDTAPFEAADRIEALIEESGRRLALARSEGVARVEQFERTEAITEQLAAARQDAKEAEAYAEELEKERDDYAHKLMQANNTYTEMHLEIERLSDKLEKAVEALLWCSGSADFNEGGVAREGWLKVCAPLLKGESHE